MNIRSPILILGMHRSGTSLLTGILREAGIYLGWRVEENLESRFHLRINEWLLRCCGGSWAFPSPIQSFITNKSFMTTATKILEHELKSLLYFYNYIGIVNYYKTNLIYKNLWGWKDPRNTFTLPLWTRIYPDLKIIYVKRNGVDVAASLLRRQKKMTENRDVLKRRSRFKLSISSIERYEMQSGRVASLRGAFDLWCEYIEQAEDIFHTFHGNKIELRFEDLLDSPIEILNEIFSFCGVDIKENSVHAYTSRLISSKKFDFVNNDKLIHFYNSVRQNPHMIKLGYSSIV